MSRKKAPVTAATRALRQAKVEFTDHLYEYEERGGTAVSSRELGVDEHQVLVGLHPDALQVLCPTWIEASRDR